MTCPRVDMQQFTELWIHTGTACNLECPFCLEGSRPGDTRLERIKLNEIKPYLDQAVQLGVQRFGFTGGEPLIVKDIVKILEYALNLRPCVVLSNGTAPLLKRLHQLQLLKQQAHTLSFRISIDYPDQHQHDTGRGWGNYQRAIEGLQLLHAQGFPVSIARQMRAAEDTASVTQHYRLLLNKAQLPEDTAVIALPEFGRPESQRPIDTAIWSNTSDFNHRHLMCTRSRMLVMRAGHVRIYACAFTDDDPHFELGHDLAVASTTEVALQHHRCQQCLKHCASL